MPNAAIPDGTGSVSDSIVVTNTGALTDLNVSLDIDHTFIGDLSVTLRHETTATTIDLLIEPGGGDCGEQNISVTLDDDAPTAVDDQCGASDPSIGGTHSPTELLANFNGEDFSGNWTLTVSDAVNDDDGTLVNWCLIPMTQGQSDAIFSNGFEAAP